jgi:DNA processing protein
MGLRMTYTFDLQNPRITLECSRPLEGGPRIAIVGSRDAEDTALHYAKSLASRIAEAGGIVVSGGAEGADTWAHRGALAVGGKTWVIAPTGRNHVFPKENASLFKEVEDSEGAMVWPFPADKHADRGGTFKKRNGVIVALADAVVVTQATTERSGTFNTANKTLAARKPLWVVPLPPWLKRIEGSRALLRRPDVRPLWHTLDLLSGFGLSKALPPPHRTDPGEQAVLLALKRPLHRDHLVDQTGLTIPQLSLVLFRLQLEGLVKERLDGCVERTG